MNVPNIQELFSLDTPEKVLKALADKGVNVTAEDVKKITELLQKKAAGELADQDLGGIAGGLIDSAKRFRR